MGTISGTVNANQGNLDQLAGDIRGHLPQLGQMAFGQNPGLQAAQGYATDVLGGKYLNSNPYLDGMISDTADDVQDRVNSMFAKSGASLGTQHAGITARELASAENNMRGQNYSMERQAQGQAAGLMPGLNASQYAGVMPYLAATQTAGGLPYQGIQNLGQMGGLVGGFGTQSGTQPGGWGNQLLSAGMMAASLFSDPRLKTNMERIGEWDDRGDGLGRWRFAYKRAPDVMLEGVMADEVAKYRPWALGPEIQGYKTVNYARLSEAA